MKPPASCMSNEWTNERNERSKRCMCMGFETHSERMAKLCVGCTKKWHRICAISKQQWARSYHTSAVFSIQKKAIQKRTIEADTSYKSHYNFEQENKKQLEKIIIISILFIVRWELVPKQIALHSIHRFWFFDYNHLTWSFFLKNFKQQQISNIHFSKLF